MKKNLFLMAMIVLICYLPLSAKTITGKVYQDLNNNRKLDDGEPGIPGVMVSNQKDVVLTDKNGNYKLKISDETIIFVTKPADWAVPLDENNIPRFYYIHQPKGSPKLKYPGIKPTGKLPSQLNFPLYRSSKQTTFKALMFGDTQPRNATEVAYLRDDVVSEVVGTDASFVLVLGDVAYDNLNVYDLQEPILGQIGVPIYYLPGNHDENYDAANDHYATETYKAHYGPNYYSFDYGNVHFIVLDDVNYLGKDEAGHVHYEGRIGKDQLQWIKNDLKYVPEEKLVVFAMHIPLFYGDGTNRALNVVDRDEFFELIQNRKHLLVIAGHMHTIDHYFLNTNHGWLGESLLHQLVCSATCGAWWSGPKDIRGIPLAVEEDGTPNGYHIFQFENNQYQELFKPASESADNQMRISFPLGEIFADSLQDKKIVVNVFDGSEKSKVWFSLDDLHWVEMEQDTIKDPYFDTFYKFPESTTPSWINPRPTSHIWTAQLPEDLEIGVHKVIVKTQDQFGNVFWKTRIFVVK